MNPLSSTDSVLEPVTIPPVQMPQNPMGLGCWSFGGGWGEQDDAASRAAMQAAWDAGMNHLDTARGYGRGRSERLVGEFLRAEGRREKAFLATKGAGSAEGIVKQLDTSLADLGLDGVDLYYIHWPRSDKDMRPVMEALEGAREAGKLKAIGVSNFSVEQMQQVNEVGTINAHQMCYNMFWRYPEKDLIPYCVENNIAVVTYSSIAEGILSGKFGPQRPTFGEGDHRNESVLFDQDVYPHLHEATEKLKPIAEEAGRSLVHLAIRWVLSRPFVTTALVGCRNAEQAAQNAAAGAGEIDPAVFDRMTAISDEAFAKVPDTGNIFRYYP